MSEIVVNGVRFHVQRLLPEGQKARATVVFIHGMIMDNLASLYYSLARPVVEAGCEAILYDLRGHGRTEKSPTGYGIDDSVADLVALLGALGVGHPVFVLGHSYGGILAQHFALAHPDRVAGVVLVESHVGAGRAAWLEDVANLLTATAIGMELNEPQVQLRDMGLKKYARMTKGLDHLLNETSLIDDIANSPAMEAEDVKAIECPMLVVFGESSDLAKAADDLKARLPNCTVRVLGGRSHTVLLDAGDELREAILSWMEEVW